LDWNALAQHGLTAAGSGLSAFLGAFLRFKTRLKECEDALKAIKDTQLPKLLVDQEKLSEHQKTMSAGWRFEFDGFKEDFDREFKHKAELEQVRRQERASHPDPSEELRRELLSMRAEIEKLKERGGRYVRNDAFTQFAKSQEDQWKEMARTLGRLEGLLRQP
jgi:hypothetical protein